MDSEDESLYVDSMNDSASDSDDIEMESESSTINEEQPEVVEYPFEVLSTEKIVQHMLDSVRDVNTIVELPATTIRILLHHFKWDKEKLMERFYDGDQDKLFAEAKVINPSRKSSAKKRRKSLRRSSSSNECQICFMVSSNEVMTGLECNHQFCSQCWGKYLQMKIMEEGMGQTISCAEQGCDIIVDDASVMRLVNDAEVKLKYQQLITNSFVECNRLLKWCPLPNCNHAIRVPYVDMKPVTCKCGHMFCFACGENWHDPIECQLLKQWIKKCSDDSETLHWLSINTKDCPKCNIPIEKNGGCNHMTCNNENCKAEFCWSCLRLWRNHGSGCNKYQEVEVDAYKTPRAALQRYLHYCYRYMNHLQSLKFEHKLNAAVKEKMLEMQNDNKSWVEVQFMKKAVDTLCQCRQTLMYTYAFAYYLKKNNQSCIFEDNQKDLESAIEELSGYLEREITTENYADLKQKVLDKYSYCDGRRKVLLEHVHEGYEKDWWDMM